MLLNKLSQLTLPSLLHYTYLSIPLSKAQTSQPKRIYNSASSPAYILLNIQTAPAYSLP